MLWISTSTWAFTYEITVNASVRWIFALPLLVLGIQIHGASPGDSDARLRAALRTPEIQLTVHFGFDTQDGMDAWDPVQDPVGEAKRLEGTLAGKTPTSAEWERLALLQSRAGLTNAATGTRARWVKQCREALAARPEDARRMAELGTALADVDAAEAGRLLRAAASKAPGDPVCQIALSRWLVGEVLRQGAESAEGDGTASRSSPETREGTRKLVTEARQALDRAVEAAPDDVDARIQRLMFHWFRAVGTMGNDAVGSDAAAGGMDVTILRGYVLPDLRKAGKLAPDDFRILALGLWVSALCDSIEHGGADAPLSAPARRSATDGIETLRQLAERAGSPEKAAAIWESRAILQLTQLKDPSGADESAAKALELQPSRPRAWSIRVAALKEAGEGDRLIQFLEQTLRRTNSVQLHLMLARMSDRENRRDAAAREVAAALALDSAHLQARAWDATLRLRNASKESEYAEVGGVIQDCLAKVSTWEPASERAPLMEHLATTGAICMALAGEQDQARQLLKQVLRQYPESEYAAEVDRILSGEPGSKP